MSNTNCPCLSIKWCFYILYLAGDVELNLGPTCYPCGACQQAVHSNQCGILCEVCYKWVHTKCTGVSNDDYFRLQQSDEVWCCKICLKEALPFHNTSNISSFDTSALDDSSFSQGVIDNSIGTKLPPISPSTSNSLNVFYANCRSLLQKIDHL